MCDVYTIVYLSAHISIHIYIYLFTYIYIYTCVFTLVVYRHIYASLSSLRHTRASVCIHVGLSEWKSGLAVVLRGSC